jgi:hypothetical protein
VGGIPEKLVPSLSLPDVLKGYTRNYKELFKFPYPSETIEIATREEYYV